MALSEALAGVRFLTNTEGKRTDVLLSWEVWVLLLQLLQELMEQVEDREDAAVVGSWLEARAGGTVETISLEALESELRDDGCILC